VSGVSEPRPARVKVTWLGHATVLIETPTARFITDPVLRHRVAHLLRQVADPAHPGVVDAVLLSHLHHDHFDKPSLRQLASPDTTVVLPDDTTRYLGAIRFGTVKTTPPPHVFAVSALMWVTAPPIVVTWNDPPGGLKARAAAGDPKTAVSSVRQLS